MCVCVFVFKKRKRIICIFQPNLSKAIAHWLLVRGQKWGKKNVWRRKKKRRYVSLCQNFTQRAVLSSFFLYKSLDSNEILLFVCLMFEMNMASVFASYIRFLIENEMKFINKIPWYNLKRLMKSKISYKQYLPRRHDLNFLMTTEFPREPLSGVWGKYFWNICVLYLEYLKYFWNVWNIWYIWNTYLKKEVKTESPRASQWSVVQMQAVSRYSRNQRFVIFRSRNIFHMKKYLSKYLSRY